MTPIGPDEQVDEIEVMNVTDKETGEFRRDDVVSFLTATHPVGGTPASAECHLVFRVP